MKKNTTNLLKHKILVVDDDPMIGDILKKLLTKNSYEVTCFTNGRRALECLKTDQFNLLITDMNMPEMCGPELIKLAKGISPGLPVLVMTGSRDEKTDDEIAKLNINGYFPKPFNLDGLVSAVTHVIATSEKRV